METVFEIVSSLLQMLIWTGFITKFLGFKNERKIYKIGFFVMWAIAFVQIYFINQIVLYDGLLTGLIVLTYFIYARSCLKGAYQYQLFLILLSTAILFTVSSVVILLMAYLCKASTGELIGDFTYRRVIIICLCRALEFFIYKTIIKINTEYKLTKKEWILFTTMPLLTWVGVTIIMKVTLRYEAIIPQMFFLSLIIVVIDVITIFFMYKIKQDMETKQDYELLKLQYDNIKSMETNMKALYENTYSVKHDLEKHFLAIKTMSDNGNCNGITEYIESIFDKNLNAVQKIIFTDTDVFNAIINTKLELCKQKGIFPSINVSNDAINFIKKSDIVVLFGNLLDNAIEAAERSKEKIIILNVQLQREYVSIFVENSYNEQFSNINMKTTKKGKAKHGFGTKIIRKIVEDNNGMIKYFTNKSGMFCCDILYKKYK